MNKVLHCIALHCIALHCIALHCIALHCIALHCIALHCIAFAVQCSAVQCSAVQCSAVQCSALTVHTWNILASDDVTLRGVISYVTLTGVTIISAMLTDDTLLTFYSLMLGLS